MQSYIDLVDSSNGSNPFPEGRSAAEYLLEKADNISDVKELYDKGRISWDELANFLKNLEPYDIMKFLFNEKFISALTTFPNHQDILINHLLTNAALYNCVFHDAEKAITLVKMFPHHASKLINLPNEQTGEHYYGKIILVDTLITLMKKLPEYKAEWLKATLYTPPDAPADLNTLYGFTVLGTELGKLAKACHPDLTDILFDYLLERKEIYEALIINTTHFDKAEVFPDHTDIVLQPTYALALEAFKNKKNKTTTATAQATPQPVQPEPEKTVEEVSQSLNVTNDAETAEITIKDMEDLSTLYAIGQITIDQIASLLKIREEYKRLIHDRSDLNNLKLEFPQLEDVLITPLLTNPEEYDRLIADDCDASLIVARFPNHEDALFNLIFEDENRYLRFISSTPDLMAFVYAHPEYKQKTLDTLVSAPHIYNTVINNNVSLVIAAGCFDAVQKNRLLICLINQPELFKERFSRSNAMHQMAATFPDFAYMLKADNAEQALKIYHEPMISVKSTVVNLKKNRKEDIAPTVVPVVEVVSPAPEVKPVVTSTSSNTSSNTSCLFANYHRKTDLEIKNEAIQLAAMNAVNAYKFWSLTGKSYRGASGKLAWWNHGKNGVEYANQFISDIEKTDHTGTIVKISEVLSKSYFKNHSLGSFLLDQLLNLENTEWKAEHFPGYKRKQPDTDVVYTSNNTNGKR